MSPGTNPIDERIIDKQQGNYQDRNVCSSYFDGIQSEGRPNHNQNQGNWNQSGGRYRSSNITITSRNWMPSSSRETILDSIQFLRILPGIPWIRMAARRRAWRARKPTIWRPKKTVTWPMMRKKNQNGLPCPFPDWTPLNCKREINKAFVASNY